MKILFVIGLGSFIGGILRYGMAQGIQSRFLSAYPFGTLSVNLLGCLLIGIVYGLSEKGNLSPEWRLFLATGLLGGFTTFSAFSNETVSMLREGQFSPAILYVVASVVLGILATFLGIGITKLF